MSAGTTNRIWSQVAEYNLYAFLGPYIPCHARALPAQPQKLFCPYQTVPNLLPRCTCRTTHGESNETDDRRFDGHAAHGKSPSQIFLVSSLLIRFEIYKMCRTTTYGR